MKKSATSTILAVASREVKAWLPTQPSIRAEAEVGDGAAPAMLGPKICPPIRVKDGTLELELLVERGTHLVSRTYELIRAMDFV